MAEGVTRWLAEAIRERDELREQMALLEKYGRHGGACRTQDCGCSCGLYEALESAEALKGAEEKG